MAHPKRKISKARRNKRRSHHAINDVTLANVQTVVSYINIIMYAHLVVTTEGGSNEGS